MKYLLSISMLFFVTIVKAQNPALLSIEGLGCDKTDIIDKQVVVTEDGGFILRISSLLFTTGNIPSCHTGINNYQQLFRKYDSTGALEWQRCYKPAAIQTDSPLLYIYPASNNNFYTIGKHGVVGGYAKYFIALEDAGQNQLWSGSGYGGAPNLILRTVCRSDDGGFFLGYTSGNTGGDVTVHYGSTMWEDIWILKLDSLGNKVWEKTVGGSGVDYPYRILPATDGGCYIIGLSDSYDYDCVGNNGSADAFIAKLDGTGTIAWSKCIGGGLNDVANDAVDDGSGSILLAGTAGGNGVYVHNHHGGYGDFWLTKIDTNGNVLWDNCYGSIYGEYANAIDLSSDGTIWITGASDGHDGQVDTSYDFGDAWTIHVDANGAFLGGKVLGAYKRDEGKMIHVLPGGIALIGGDYYAPGAQGGEFLSTKYGTTQMDIFLARLAPWTTSVTNRNSSILKCQVFPNPGDKIINIELPDKDKTYHIDLYDNKGGVVYQNRIKGKNVFTITTENFARGVYHLSISDESNGKYNERIVLK